MESFQAVSHRVFNRYFCVLASECRPRPHRLPIIPYNLCNDYYKSEYNEELTCCHQSDFKQKPDSTWTNSFKFLPSFRSYISKFACCDCYLTHNVYTVVNTAKLVLIFARGFLFFDMLKYESHKYNAFLECQWQIIRQVFTREVLSHVIMP